jgi:hypothetical protein
MTTLQDIGRAVLPESTVLRSAPGSQNSPAPAKSKRSGAHNGSLRILLNALGTVALTRAELGEYVGDRIRHLDRTLFNALEAGYVVRGECARRADAQLKLTPKGQQRLRAFQSGEAWVNKVATPTGSGTTPSDSAPMVNVTQTPTSACVSSDGQHLARCRALLDAYLDLQRMRDPLLDALMTKLEQARAEIEAVRKC